MMNFSFLEPIKELAPFYSYCQEAESFALSHPDISITASRKAMEYMVKLLYGSAISRDISGLTTFDMLADPDFVYYMDDRPLLDAFHLIRKKGNLAVHQGGMTQDDAVAVLEQLHYLAGETAIRLNLISGYSSFNKSLLPTEEQQPQSAVDDAEPQIDPAVIAYFFGRMHNVHRFSELEADNRRIINTFIDSRIIAAQRKVKPAVQGTDFANNSRVAFHQAAAFFVKRLGDANVIMDCTQNILQLHMAGKTITVAVKTGSGRIGVKTPQGEWVLLPGIDALLYTPDLTADKPVLEQLRVFTKQEYIALWQELGMIIPRLTSGYRNMLRSALGPSARISYKDYANELSLQNLRTMHRSKRERMQQALEALPTLENGGYEKIAQIEQ